MKKFTHILEIYSYNALKIFFNIFHISVYKKKKKLQKLGSKNDERIHNKKDMEKWNTTN